MQAIACVLGLAVLTGCTENWTPSDPSIGASAGYKTQSEQMMDVAAGMMSGPTAGAGLAKGILLQQSMPGQPMPPLFP